MWSFCEMNEQICEKVIIIILNSQLIGSSLICLGLQSLQNIALTQFIVIEVHCDMWYQHLIKPFWICSTRKRKFDPSYTYMVIEVFGQSSKGLVEQSYHFCINFNFQLSINQLIRRDQPFQVFNYTQISQPQRLRDAANRMFLILSQEITLFVYEFNNSRCEVNKNLHVLTLVWCSRIHHYKSNTQSRTTYSCGLENSPPECCS